MNETTPAEAGKLTPWALNKTSVNTDTIPKHKTSLEEQCSPENQKQSPLNKKRKSSLTPESTDLFEATTAAASRDVNMLLSQFSEVLSERAAADKAQMEELESILTEARNLVSFLKEKKNHLKQMLARISDKL